MSNANTKISAVLKLFLALGFCLVISLGIYLIATPFIFGAWHCPHPPCNSPDWIQWTVFLILLSPLLVFTIGAYLSRGVVADLTETKFLRVLTLLIFAFFPILMLAGLIVYIINSN